MLGVTSRFSLTFAARYWLIMSTFCANSSICTVQMIYGAAVVTAIAIFNGGLCPGGLISAFPNVWKSTRFCSSQIVITRHSLVDLECRVGVLGNAPPLCRVRG